MDKQRVAGIASTRHDRRHDQTWLKQRSEQAQVVNPNPSAARWEPTK
jgi:hypothetical protein